MQTNSQTLFSRAQQHIPAGVNSPVRAFGSVGGTPPFIENGCGAYITDTDQKTYTDYVGSWGPMILGHAHPAVLDAVISTAKKGLSFGAPTAQEVDMADLLCQLVPSMDMVRLVSSGTEATMSAIRLARGHTNRHTLIKFEGCYHGHSDSLLVKAGSGLLTFGNPSSAGVPPETANHTLVLEYNNIEQIQAVFKEKGHLIAAVIVEPVAGNMNLVRPTQGFLQELRHQCTLHGSVLIFDEVMTGFRVAPQCAQGLYNIDPDLTTLGKIIGGGMPVGAFGGKRHIMEKIAPLGPVYQAGTLSGNPVAVAAGLKTLELIQAPGFYEDIANKTTLLCDGLTQAAQKNGIVFSAQSIGGMFGLYFRETPPGNFSEVMQSDTTAFNHFFHEMLRNGHYFAPSAFEAGFVSAAHSTTDINKTIQAAASIFSNWPKAQP